MPTRVPLRCRCGEVRGVATDVSPEAGNRVVCYCDDCQAVAQFLSGGEGLDPAGGTDVFQVAPCTVSLTQGADLLRCVRLSDRGLFRFYTDCCRTRVGAMLGPRVPFLALVDAFMDHDGDGRSRDEVLGRPLGFIFGKYAVGGLPPHAHRKVPLGLLVRLAWKIFRWWIAGRNAPSAFFDAQTRAPRAAARVLTAAERQALTVSISS
jgi:hypothetical protein